MECLISCGVYGSENGQRGEGHGEGCSFGYQNIMYLAAGQIIPAVTGKSWDDFVRQRIFMPLGMTASHTSVPTQPSADDVATPHAWLDRRMWNTSHLVFKRGPEVSEVTIETR